MEHDYINTVLERHGLKRTDIAAQMGVDKATVTRWFQGKLTVERALDVERVTGIPRHELRPDVFEPSKAKKTKPLPEKAKQ